MRSKILGGLLAALAALAVLAAPAGAVVANTEGGRVSYLPLNEAATAHSTAPIRNAVPSGKPPLEYNGGPVMHSQTSYAIFWAPSGYAFPSGYASAIEEFLENVATDSGKPSNVYSISAQYTDGTGHAAYSDSFGGSVIDTTPYPTSGTCAPYTGEESFTACISDAKLAAEVNAVITAQGWPHGLGAEYYAVLPPHAGSCFGTTLASGCFDVEFCAYHSFIESPETIYSNISYSPGDVEGCGVGEYPNGHANGNVDDTLSSLSHEANESITDPTLEAWYDQKGFENGDECRNTPLEEDFGDPLGGSEEAETLFNQTIGDAHYYLQQEWSNNIEDCAQRTGPAIPAISGPSQLAPGQSGSFSGAGSSPGESAIVSYGWRFGDGGTATGATASHAFAGPGVFPVTLTLEDEWGLLYSTTRQVTVATPNSGVTTPISTPVAVKKGLKCRKGFKKGRKHGKPACVKIKKKHRKHR